MAVAFTTYFVTVLILRMRAELVAAKIRAIRLTQVHGQPAPVGQ